MAYIGENMNSQQTSHALPLLASHGTSSLNEMAKNGRVISVFGWGTGRAIFYTCALFLAHLKYYMDFRNISVKLQNHIQSIH